ncbi:hypothetical protein AB0C07_34385 [Actinoplanes missouriensis]|uniref:hypothetical protein n=1 Tax=Actinoplanes missouriensis TaxID=1866 RepID=UPI0033F37A5D
MGTQTLLPADPPRGGWWLQVDHDLFERFTMHTLPTADPADSQLVGQLLGDRLEAW